jgi:hypothetical protein
MTYFKVEKLIDEPDEKHKTRLGLSACWLGFEPETYLQEAEVQSTQAPLQDIKEVIMDGPTIFMGNRITAENAITAE